MKISADSKRRFAEAMGGASFVRPHNAARLAGMNGQAQPVSPAPAARDPDAGSIRIGDAEIGGPVDLGVRKLIEGRLLIQGTSGAGKTWTLRRLIERTAGIIQQIVVDPEGEFASLAEEIDFLRLDAARLDTATLALAASRAREHRVSVLLDLSDLDRDGQMIAFAAFATGLIAVPREHWRPVLVTVDEAHLFAPFGGASGERFARKQAIAAVTDLMSRGRKRGIATVLATQRLVRLAKSVISEAHNFMVGLNTLDLDIKRAAETIGWEARKAFDRLPMLSPGDFVVVGPAFSRSPAIVRVGPVKTRHLGATPELDTPVSIDAGEAASLLGVGALVAASEEDRAVRENHLPPVGQRSVRAFIRDPGFADAGRIWGALQTLAPDGAGVADLARNLDRQGNAITDALALLDGFGAVEFLETETPDGPGRAVRIDSSMLAGGVRND